MSSAVDFDLTVNCDRDQRLRATEVDAYVSITARSRGAGPPESTRGGQLAQVILLDLSSSMTRPPSKFASAQQACCAALDALPDGTRFAIVGGTSAASMLYPPQESLALTGAVTREAAKRAIRGAEAGGGTIISAWLDKARELFVPYSGLMCHAILLTDGRNEHQELAARSMEEALADCHGSFACDARGIGADWEPPELRRIAEELRGTSDAVPDFADLENDFRTMTRTALSRVVSVAALRVRCSPGVTVAAVEQHHPQLSDLTAQATRVAGTPATDFPLGPWSEEAREYVVILKVDHDAPPPGATDLLASIEVVTGRAGATDAVRGSDPVPIDVRWVDIPPQRTEVGPRRTHFQSEKRLRELRYEGGRLFKAGDPAGAVDAWGRAVALATELGNQDALRRLRKVVRVDDAAQGVVSLLPGLEPEYALNAMMGDSTSSPFRRQSPTAPEDRRPPAGPGRRCPSCGRVSTAGTRFCETKDCAHEFTGAPVENG